MTMTPRSVEIRGSADVLLARREAKELAARLRLGSADQTRLATAISELTRNVVQHAGPAGGVCRLYDESGEGAIAIRVEVEDWGPGIADIAAAMRDGYSTRGGLGAGLPGTRRLMDELSLESRPGRTLVTVRMLRPRT